MAIIDTNEQNYRTRTFDGFIQMQDPDTPSNYLRFKERQSVNVTFRFGREGHYNDAGRKKLDPVGHNHTFDMRLKFTNDLLSSSDDPPTDQSTLSYWLYQNALFNPVELVFVTTLVSVNPVTASESYGHFKFKLDPDTFGPITFNNSSGLNEIGISGEVIEIVTAVRTSSNAAPSDPSSNDWHP